MIEINSQTTMKTYEKAKLSLISIQQPMRSMWLIILNKKKIQLITINQTTSQTTMKT